MYDVIVVGAGPAGLTAAIYLGRAEKKVLVIEKECFGGQITHSPRVENYPGSRSVSGAELGDMLFEHASDLGCEIELDTVVKIQGEAGSYEVVCEGGVFSARAVIIATGSRHRTLGIEGEESFVGEGISYCAVCDGAFFKDRTVAVIGGGNSALQEAVMLSELASKVYVIQNLGFLTGERSLAHILEGRNNVEIILGSVVKELVTEGDSFGGIFITSADGDRTLKLDGIFVAIGQMPECEAFRSVAHLNEQGYIKAGEDCIPEGAPKGIFVAGDCRTKAVRQVATAVADGSVAALSAIRFIDSL